MLHLITDKLLEVRAYIKENIKDHTYSLTMDHWASRSKETFGAITAHFIDNLKFFSQTLCCEKFPGGVKLVDIYTYFLRDLSKHGIDIADCVKVVRDTTEIMNKFRKHLQDKLNIDHILYIDHLFHLTAKLAFKSTRVRRKRQKKSATATHQRAMT
jgi:hypothetical protein